MKSMRFGRRGVLKGATATAALMGAVRASFPAGAFAQGAGPETNKVTLGFIALTDASTASNAWHADASGTIPTITNS